MRFEVQGAYEKKKEAVTEEMEVEAGKMEKDFEEDFGVVSKLPTRGQIETESKSDSKRCHAI